MVGRNVCHRTFYQRRIILVIRTLLLGGVKNLICVPTNVYRGLVRVCRGCGKWGSYGVVGYEKAAQGNRGML